MNFEFVGVHLLVTDEKKREKMTLLLAQRRLRPIGG